MDHNKMPIGGGQGYAALATAKQPTLMEQSGSLSAQASDLYELLTRIEQHLIGSLPRDTIGGALQGAQNPVSPQLQIQLRDTSNVLRQAYEVGQRIKDGLGI